MTTVTTIVS